MEILVWPLDCVQIYHYVMIDQKNSCSTFSVQKLQRKKNTYGVTRGHLNLEPENFIFNLIFNLKYLLKLFGDD